MAPPLFRDHSAAVATKIASTGLLVDRGKAPAGGGWQGTPGQSVFKPYAVVWLIPGSTITGTLGNPDDDGSLVVQVTSVGPNDDGAELVADQVRGALLAGITVAGRSILRVSFDSTLGVTPDDELQPTLWLARDRYRIESTPA